MDRSLAWPTYADPPIGTSLTICGRSYSAAMQPSKNFWSQPQGVSARLKAQGSL